MTDSYVNNKHRNRSRVQRFRGSRVVFLYPNSILKAYLCEKRQASSLPIWKLASHWQLCGKIHIFYEDFRY